MLSRCQRQQQVLLLTACSRGLALQINATTGARCLGWGSTGWGASLCGRRGTRQNITAVRQSGRNCMAQIFGDYGLGSTR